MTSYADKNSKWVYDWPEIINRGESGDFTSEEADEWKKAAASWVTCACGNQCADIPRGERGHPMDEELRIYGASFSSDIVRLLWSYSSHKRKSAATAARITLSKIEGCSAILLIRN